MRVLVAGGAGYIGSVVVESLLATGNEVCVVDNLSKGHRGAVSPGARLEVGDIADARFLDGVLGGGGFDAVMHFCAASLVGESVANPALYYANNLGGGIRLVEAMLRHGVKRLIFSSTAAIFGEPATLPIAEDDAKAPTNPYGRTKLYFEGFLGDCDAAYGLRSVCLRYFNAAGATERCGEDHNPETHLIPLALKAVAGTGKPLTVFGEDYPTPDGTCVRDYVHVTDLAAAHLAALDHLTKSDRSERFNLGNGDGYSVREVLRVTEAVTGKPVPHSVGPRRAGDPASLVASSNKIRSLLGWQPRHPRLEDIVESAWRWMRNHPDGYTQTP